MGREDINQNLALTLDSFKSVLSHLLDVWCKKKFDEAVYFAEEMSNHLHNNDPATSGYYLSAYLSAIRSVADHALEDVARSFSIQIPLECKCFRKAFKDEAKTHTNASLTAFMTEWELLNKMLERRPIAKLRHVNIHRRTIEIKEKDVAMSDEEGGRYYEEYDTSILSSSILGPDGEELTVYEFYAIDGHEDPLEKECYEILDLTKILVKYVEDFVYSTDQEDFETTKNLKPLFRNTKWDRLYEKMKKEI